MRFSKIIMAGIAVLAIISIASCSSSKEGRGMRHDLNGSWNLQTINVQGISGSYKVNIFNEADYSCFIGSQWNFIANNNTGVYKLLSSTQCASVTRNIKWSIYEQKGQEKKFQFKRLDDKKNSMDNDDGFRLTIISLTENSMDLAAAILFEGKNATINYHFVKIN